MVYLSLVQEFRQVSDLAAIRERSISEGLTVNKIRCSFEASLYNNYKNLVYSEEQKETLRIKIPNSEQSLKSNSSGEYRPNRINPLLLQFIVDMQNTRDGPDLFRPRELERMAAIPLNEFQRPVDIPEFGNIFLEEEALFRPPRPIDAFSGIHAEQIREFINNQYGVLNQELAFENDFNNQDLVNEEYNYDEHSRIVDSYYSHNRSDEIDYPDHLVDELYGNLAHSDELWTNERFDFGDAQIVDGDNWEDSDDN
jgi:hypothetical protein